jgi:hypothetical protein
METISSSTSSSSATAIAADIRRLIGPSDRPGFDAMLANAIRGRELPDDELRRIAERTWRAFCRFGWPRDAT